MNAMSRVTVELPTHRLHELYRKLAELCQPENDASLHLTSWEPMDMEIASKVYEAMSSDAQAIYDTLFETEQGFTVEELAEKAGKKPSQIRGALSWPATHAKNSNKVPIHAQTPDGKVFVPADVANIFLFATGRTPKGKTAPSPATPPVRNTSGKEMMQEVERLNKSKK